MATIKKLDKTAKRLVYNSKMHSRKMILLKGFKSHSSNIALTFLQHAKNLAKRIKKCAHAENAHGPIMCAMIDVASLFAIISPYQFPRSRRENSISQRSNPPRRYLYKERNIIEENLAKNSLQGKLINLIQHHGISTTVHLIDGNVSDGYPC